MLGEKWHGISITDSSSENFSVNEKAYDFGIGLSGNIRSVFGGIAIEHIARPNFSDQVDNYIPLEKDSREEIEIRSATIYICDLIAKKKEIGASAAAVENAIWSLSQTHIKQHPYHRVLTTNY